MDFSGTQRPQPEFFFLSSLVMVPRTSIPLLPEAAHILNARLGQAKVRDSETNHWTYHRPAIGFRIITLVPLTSSHAF